MIKIQTECQLSVELKYENVRTRCSLVNYCAVHLLSIHSTKLSSSPSKLHSKNRYLGQDATSIGFPSKNVLDYTIEKEKSRSKRRTFMDSCAYGSETTVLWMNSPSRSHHVASSRSHLFFIQKTSMHFFISFYYEPTATVENARRKQTQT